MGGQIQFVGNKIYDAGGQQIIARGPEDNIWDPADVDRIAATGANAMRMLFNLDAEQGNTPAVFDSFLAEAAAKHMVVWVSLESFSGNIGADLGGGNFQLPALWSRQWLKDLMAKYKANVIIDAGQEFIGVQDPGTEAGRQEWAAAAKADIAFFRSQGYTNPLEIMGNIQGRDLYATVEYGQQIIATDPITVNGQPQTMFGWQAYWGTADGFYPQFFGNLFLGGTNTLSGAQAIHQFAATQPFPIEIGIDNYDGDTFHDYKAEIDAAAADNMSWLWWSWQGTTVEAPADGAVCQAYVMTSPNGFAGAKPVTQTGLILTAVTETPSSGDLNAGNTVTIALGTSEAVTVSGSPTLTLNDGGTATYDAGTSTSTSLVFNYTVASTDTNVASLAVTSLDVPAGASIVDDAGSNLDPSLSGLTQTGPQISTSSPILDGLIGSPTIGAGEMLEVTSTYSGKVSFTAPTGILELLNSSSFAGTVAGMTGQDTIDFADIDPTKVQAPSYSGDASSGTLSLTDGSHIANVALLGNYLASTFVSSSDGHGGTNINVASAADAGQSALLGQPHA